MNHRLRAKQKKKKGKQKLPHQSFYVHESENDRKIFRNEGALNVGVVDLKADDLANFICNKNRNALIIHNIIRSTR